jgi:RimJ/RimL family protein N-acetyltransferase
LVGRRVSLEPLDPAAHGPALFAAATSGPDAARTWDFMGYGPFADAATMAAWLEGCAGQRDPLFFAVIDLATGAACGMVAWLNIRPEHGVLEAGHIWYAPAVRRTGLPTEAMLLMFEAAFDRLGYRRLEWKCDAKNAASRQAALRLGLTCEGTFRQHMIVKGRNRDTAWFAPLDRDWPSRRAALAAWLEPANFDPAGRQRSALGRGVWR